MKKLTIKMGRYRRLKNKKDINKMPLFRGTLRLRIEGLNQPRLISKLVKEDIRTKNITRENTSIMTLDINKKDSKKAFAILQNLCYNYSVVCVSGAASVFRVAATRVGLIIGLVIFTSAVALSRGFIWQMQINGCDNVSEQVIELLLKTNNIRVGKSLKNIDKNLIKNELNKTAGVVESSIEIKGTTVIISIMESTHYEPKTATQATDIVSKYDAQITRIVSLSGTCLVSRGQKIFKGAPLIGAYRLNPEGAKVEQVNASGMVFGNVTITKSITLSTKEYILKESGKTYSNSILKLFGLTFGKYKNPFENYRSQKETLYPFDGNFIPLKLERETFYETERVLVEHDLTDLMQQIISEYVLENVIKCGGNEIKTTSDVKLLSENLYTLDIFMQAEMPLC